MDGIGARPDRLRELVAAIFARLGSGEDEARTIADNLVLANMSGHDSHGVGLVPTYARAVRSGVVMPNRRLTIVVDAGPILTVDAGMGFGQTAGREAMALAIERARRHGLCAAAIRNSHHLGRIGHWAEQCAEAGLVSTHYVNTLGIAPHVAPFAGSDARYSTNPYCCGVPGRAGEPPLVLDMATSKVALGKLRVAKNKGLEVEPDTIIDGHGQPTRDPHVLFSDPIGAILPFGAHKGSGLAVVCELLGGALTGGGAWHEGTRRTGVIHNNMLSIVLDPDRFGAAETWREDAARCLRWVKASPPGPGHEAVLTAGEPERRSRSARAASIPIDGNTWAEITAIAGEVGVDGATVSAVG